MNVNNNDTAAWEEINMVVLDILWYYEAIIIPLGMLGNCLSVCVFFRTKLRYSSSSIYLSALALSDTGYLAAYLHNWHKHNNICNISNNYNVFTAYLENLCTFLSVWFVVVFTIERYVVIRWPLRRKFLSTVARAKIVVIVLTGIAIVYSILIGWMEYSYFNTDYNEVGYDDNSTFNIYNYKIKMWKIFLWKIYSLIVPIMVVFSPLTVIIIFNILIAHKIYRQNRIRKIFIIESNSSNERIHISDNETPQIKITKMLILVSSMFVCLTVPKSVCWYIKHYYDGNPKWLTPWWEISKRLYLTNFTITFILYCASGQNFRRALICMFMKRSESQKMEAVMQMTNNK